MTPEEAKTLLIEVVSEIQVQSCRDLPPVHGGTRLQGDVPGCDSVAVVEIGIYLSERLASQLGGCDLPERLLLGTRQHLPTIDEIAGEVAEYVSRKEKQVSKGSSCGPSHQALDGAPTSCGFIVDAEPCSKHHFESVNRFRVTDA